ncbi:CELL WALL / VACUOLAR INHIBITOR OF FRUCTOSIDASE 2, cell wall / vacuolar inhibitor of fructosidase 2 [Hibiscus trionum]|uniref:CELL WALL / VACUOLAR INHIBITOR OF FRUCTOSIDASE 2, cell wall / vacuolar inhibitor of fructosidase 2 n=1 Tax=Hibiscus trionum TaxID=183268 RepID=A0A9W7MM22_HIBTR|nr:CELL WALL / VACUOLAR INHIBITOR OF FRUCTOSIDASE 2, cell wall / vacuolar inhibitor of fructosidase 2 [Hibiscus trionum]
MARFQFVLIFFLCYTLSPPPAATGSSTNKLVDKICNRTSNYTFCAEALYSDPRTPTADAYGLAFVSFGLAYLNATATQDYIAQLLNDNTIAANHKRRLKLYQHDYSKAVSALEEAYDDLNSETFFQLAKLAGHAAAAADDCQSAFKGAHYSPLATMNDCLKALSNICVIVSKLFTGGIW